MNFSPRFMATSLSVVPHRDLQQICRMILENFPEAPTIPRLTSSLRMLTEGMPCLVVDRVKRVLSFELTPDREHELIEFYEHVDAGDVDYFAISEGYMSGFDALLRILKDDPPPELKVVHIQIPGPVSWALATKDDKGTPAFYNPTLRDVMVKTIAMKAKWQEKKVKEIIPGIKTMVIYGDPSLGIHTSAMGGGAREDMINAVNEIVEAVEGMAGIHCCANIDWTVLTESKDDLINFDAYEYSDKLALYPKDLNLFLERGGMLAWGIVPTFDEKIAMESVDTLTERLDQGIELMIDRGVEKALLVENSCVTPSCNTGSMSLDLAERVFVYTSEISHRMRERYCD